MLNIDECYETVKDWHVTFGQPASNTVLSQLEPARETLRARLVSEEYCEFVRALFLNNKVEMADGLADTIWVLCGTAVELGDNRIRLFNVNPLNVTDLFSYHLHSPMNLAFDLLKYFERSFSDMQAQAVWNEVKRSNFAKLWTKEEVDGLNNSEDVVGWTKTFIESKCQYVVMDETGKIRKPPSWTAPNIAAIINS